MSDHTRHRPQKLTGEHLFALQCCAAKLEEIVNAYERSTLSRALILDAAASVRYLRSARANTDDGRGGANRTVGGKIVGNGSTVRKRRSSAA
jgi:hypothetical protein